MTEEELNKKYESYTQEEIRDEKRRLEIEMRSAELKLSRLIDARDRLAKYLSDEHFHKTELKFIRNKKTLLGKEISIIRNL